jgi:Ca2+-transporting ATPase
VPLTGSTPVAPTGPDTPLAERHDFVFMGTSVATGTGLAEVVATGMQTELGRIAHLLSTAEESVTPLQRRLARVSQTLVYICGGIVAVVALAGWLRGWPLMQVFMAAVSLAVAAVPEGLPAVVTDHPLLGVEERAPMRIREGPAVETLGFATADPVQTTGTLTTGEKRLPQRYFARAAADAEISTAVGVGSPPKWRLRWPAERGIPRRDPSGRRSPFPVLNGS